jgi:hypothetical protein
MLKAEIRITDKKREKLRDDEGRPMLPFARAKVEFYLSQLSTILPFMHRIRPHQIPGGRIILQSLQRAILFGPLSMLLDERQSALDVSLDGPADASIPFLVDMVSKQLEKYNKESLAYDDAKIKYLIAVRNEKERVSIIKSFDEKSEEEKQVELINKRRGLGKWAIGGTKAIYAYDKEHFDRESRQRLEMGMNEFPGMEESYEVDEMGFQVDNNEYGEGGYDHEQLNADDA